MGMVEFDRFDCNIPLEFVTETEAYFLEKQGIRPKPDDSGELSYQKLNVSDFPGILYSARLVPFYGLSVPLYAQVLFRSPCAELKWHRDWNDFVKRDTLVMPEFLKDLDDFPLEPFYERLLKLRGIRVEHDTSQKPSGLAEPGRIIFNGTLESRLANFPWFAHTFLHELYHQVEFEMGEEVENYFCDNPRWLVERRCMFYDEDKTRKYGCGERWWHERRRQARRVDPQELGAGSRNSGESAKEPTNVAQRLLFTHVSYYQLEWHDEGCDLFGEHLAEWLAALTTIRHPEIFSMIRHYYELVRDRFSSGQLSLLPLLVWSA